MRPLFAGSGRWRVEAHGLRDSPGQAQSWRCRPDRHRPFAGSTPAGSIRVARGRARVRSGDYVPAVRIVALLLGILILAAVLWAASESHYNACVQKASASYPVVRYGAN